MTRAESHTVIPSEAGVFLVKSGTSGRCYVVTPLKGDRAACACAAGRVGAPCTHVDAVRMFAGRVLAVARPLPAPPEVSR